MSTTNNNGAIYHDGIKPEQVKAHADYVARLRKTALALGQRNPDGITADDLHAACPVPPGIDPRVMGTAFDKGQWEHRGWQTSTRKVNHGRPIRIWALRNLVRN